MHDASRRFEVTPADLPSPPMASARIIRLASDPNVNAARLGEIISSDPAFTAELLRTVNSSFFALKVEIATPARAVAVLGTRTLRNLAICFAVRDAVRGSGFRADDLKEFWEDSLRRAVAARLVASHAGLRTADEAFTVGLLQDFGVLAMLKSQREQVKDWPEVRKLLPGPRRCEESNRFGTTHERLLRLMAVKWGLPDALTVPLSFHHDVDSAELPPEHRELAVAAQRADDVAAVFTAGDKMEALHAARAGLERDYGMNAEVADGLLARVGDEVEGAAAGLGLRVRKQQSFDEVIREANRALVQLNLSYEELAQRLESALAEKNQLATQLQEANARLERLAYFDPLTGLCNRRRFDELFRVEIRRAVESRRPLSILVIDLDRFKHVNDTYGHPFGDAVLTGTAAALGRATRTCDIRARLGGEEFVVLLPETDAAMASRAAEAVRAEVARVVHTSTRGPLTVTASVGGATFPATTDPGDEAMMKYLLDAGDQALYRSKQEGRNRVSWAPA
jgi:diguanylate cyclase (GGDEF)-like protein